MNAFKLYATLTLNSSAFQQALGGAKNGLANFAKSAALTQAAIAAIEKGMQAMSSVTKQSIANYGEYEQLIGGVEKLFGKSADKVVKNAQKAYKSAQISQNQYMSLATTFSASLIQGLKGNTEKAAELTNTAITDMADNANVFGSSMAEIENAYKGFAKQNYTMLDNLKLGYGGTKEEMLRLVNDAKISKDKIEDLDDVSFADIIKAIHKIQQNLKITGTTSKEAATTLEGSAGSMKAAFQDFLTSISTGDESEINSKMTQFQTAFDTYMSNLIPVAINSVGGSGALIKGVMNAITNISEEDMAALTSAGEKSITDMVGGLTNITQWLINGITSVINNPDVQSDTGQLGTAIGTWLGKTVRNLVTNAPEILAGVIDLGMELGAGVIQGLFTGMFGGDDTKSEEMQSKLSSINETLTQSIADAWEKATTASTITQHLQSLIDKYGSAATQTDEWKQSVSQLEAVLPGASSIIQKHENDIENVVTDLNAAIEKEKQFAIEAAKQKATQDKFDAYAQASAEYASAVYQKELDKQRIAGAKEKVAGLDNIGYYDGAGQFLVDQSTGELNMDMFKSLADIYGAAQLAKNFVDPTGALEGTEGYEEKLGEAQGAIQALADAQTSFSDADKAIKDLETAMALAKAEYDISAAAVASLADGEASAAAGMEVAAEGGTHAGTVLNSLKAPNFGGGGGQAQPKATGMDYVPYDDYYARLHKGEAVLTRAEATIWRKGASNGFTSYNEHNNVYVGTMNMANDYSPNELMNNLAAYQRRRNAGYGM